MKTLINPILHTFKSRELPFLILLLIVPLQTHALLFTYNYTGNPFCEVNGSAFSDPNTTYNINVEFKYDGDLQTGQYSTIPFTIYDGFHVLHSWDNTIQHAILSLIVPEGALFPSEWNIELESDEYYMVTYNSFELPMCDGWDLSEFGQDSWAGNYDNWGIWTRNEMNAPVPEPITLILMGSGLAGIVAFRKKVKKTP